MLDGFAIAVLKRHSRYAFDDFVFLEGVGVEFLKLNFVCEFEVTPHNLDAVFESPHDGSEAERFLPWRVSYPTNGFADRESLDVGCTFGVDVGNL